MDESIDVRPEAIQLQQRLLEVAKESQCTLEEAFLAGCGLVANVIALAHTDGKETDARIRHATKSIKAVVKMALADMHTPTIQSWH
jgi:hypothetical protein